jgi:catechol 2,3-dioxygenase-like lactoylglutathione lyase family enzyme
MLDHLGVAATDYRRSRAFYERALAPLDVVVVMAVTREMTGTYEGCGFGPRGGRSQFRVGEGSDEAGRGIRIAFTASTRTEVGAFHAAAITAGGTDNGVPGLDPHYRPNCYGRPNYYGAFAIDPEGHNVEAVCHAPEDHV